MVNRIRYALAVFCFALGVACLGLWWRSHIYRDACIGPALSESNVIYLESWQGFGWVASLGQGAALYADQIFTFRSPDRQWQFLSQNSVGMTHEMRTKDRREKDRLFGYASRSYHFPLWFPALVFALAGIGALRLGRRFTIRSAIIATTAVAGLLGMAVAL